MAIDGRHVPDALAIGAAQALALIPGISRSGISISAGLFAGLNREAAARFSFLMATPITAGAGIYEVRRSSRGEAACRSQTVPLVAGMVAVVRVRASSRSPFLLRFLRTRSPDVFVAYRLVLAAVVLVVWLAPLTGTAVDRWRS